MKLSIYIISAFIIFTLFASCSDDHGPSDKFDCTFVQNDGDKDGLIDETERSIMTTCIEERFTSIAEIKSNLIGEWELIGHGEGWDPTRSKPCGYIIFTENEFEFEYQDANTDTMIRQSWDIEKVDWAGGTYFKLRTDPNYIHTLFASRFCNNYFFGDATPRDGNMYLYEKVK
jgi:hypothetical protein